MSEGLGRVSHMFFFGGGKPAQKISQRKRLSEKYKMDKQLGGTLDCEIL
jgi:hypothetical protein